MERLWTGARWTEGPVYFGDGRFLLFSDIPNNRILRWDEETRKVSLFRRPSHYSNGHTRDRQGRLVSCEHYTRRVTRTEPDGSLTVLLDSFDGRRLNAPTMWSCTLMVASGLPIRVTVFSSPTRASRQSSSCHACLSPGCAHGPGHCGHRNARTAQRLVFFPG